MGKPREVTILNPTLFGDREFPNVLFLKGCDAEGVYWEIEIHPDTLAELTIKTRDGIKLESEVVGEIRYGAIFSIRKEGNQNE